MSLRFEPLHRRAPRRGPAAAGSPGDGRRWAVPCRPRIVAIGGGTGMPVVLRGLRRALFPEGRPPGRATGERERITAVVTVADDGGSSGRLRRAYRVPAPGDARNCLLALSESRTLSRLFATRFKGTTGVGGHSLGNLILTALWERDGDFAGALRRAGRMLRACGSVVPCTRDEVTLRAEFEDGTRVDGETRITRAGRRIRRVHLLPAGARTAPPATEAIATADLVVLGPGSLYTSLLPVVLVRGIARAIAASGARTILVANLMSEPGETDGYAVSDLVRALHRHVPGLTVDEVLLNDAPPPAGALAAYRRAGSRPIAADETALRRLGCRVVARDLLRAGSLIRHDPAKLAAAILGRATGARFTERHVKLIAGHLGRAASRREGSG